MYVSFHGVKRRIIIRVFVGICRKTLGFGRFSRQPTHPTALHQFANMLNLSFRRLRARFTLLAVVALSALLLRSVAFAQTSVSNGSISGTVTDSTGAVVPNAKVTITGPTGQTVRANTSDAGTYSSGALIPGFPPQKNRIPRFWPKPEGICGMIAMPCLLPASSFS